MHLTHTGSKSNACRISISCYAPLTLGLTEKICFVFIVFSAGCFSKSPYNDERNCDIQHKQALLL